METKDIAREIYGEESTDCRYCENSGIYYAPNGKDDFTPEYCQCKEGVRAEENNAMRVLKVDWQPSEGTPDVFIIG